MEKELKQGRKRLRAEEVPPLLHTVQRATECLHLVSAAEGKFVKVF